MVRDGRDKYGLAIGLFLHQESPRGALNDAALSALAYSAYYRSKRRSVGEEQAVILV